MVKLKLQAALVVVVVFVLGMLTGFGVTRTMGARAIVDIADGPPELAQGRMMAHMLGRRLHLSRDQRGRVREIFDRRANDFLEIRARNEPEVAKVREQIREEIVALLEEKQREEFARLEGELTQRRERMGIAPARRGHSR